MPSWLQHISGHHIVILLVILSSVWGWVSKMIRESAARRKAEIARRQSQDDLLRSGRAPSEMPGLQVRTPVTGVSQQMDPRRMLEEIAAKRQQQLEELRRKQLGQPSASQGPALPRPPAGTMSPEKYNQLKRQQAQREIEQRAIQARAQQAANQKAAQAQRAAQAEQARRAADANAQRANPTRSRPSQATSASIQRDRALHEQEQAARAVQADAARAQAQAEPVAEVAHARGGSTVGISRHGAAGITVLGAKVTSAKDWRRLMALQAILGPSAASRDLEGLPDPLRS